MNALRTGRSITFQYLLRNITAERDGYYEEAKVIYRPVLSEPIGPRAFAGTPVTLRCTGECTRFYLNHAWGRPGVHDPK
jgi:hypothetical protein